MNPDAPVATTEQFKQALLALRDANKLRNPIYVAMLRIHCNARLHKITATRLAEAMSFEGGYPVANSQYGTLAHMIADEIGYKPYTWPDGTQRWWPAISIGRSAEDGVETLDGQFEMTMRPELVAALQAMKWDR